jgi:phage N-6-adenine-methyltransferase
MTIATQAIDDFGFVPMNTTEASTCAQRWLNWGFTYTSFVKPSKPRTKRSRLMSAIAEVTEQVQGRLAAMHSSVRNDWATPAYVFDPLNAEFGFDLDPCCKAETAKCKGFFTPIDDGLSQSWANRTVWMNPPYGRKVIDKWMDKARQSAWLEGATVVCLVPVHASSQWFKKAMQTCDEVRFVEGRIKFVGAKHFAPFSSAVFVFRAHSPNRLNSIND